MSSIDQPHFFKPSAPVNYANQAHDYDASALPKEVELHHLLNAQVPQELINPDAMRMSELGALLARAGVLKQKKHTGDTAMKIEAMLLKKDNQKT